MIVLFSLALFKPPARLAKLLARESSGCGGWRESSGWWVHSGLQDIGSEASDLQALVVSGRTVKLQGVIGSLLSAGLMLQIQPIAVFGVSAQLVNDGIWI